MQIRELCRGEVVSVLKETSLQDVASLMEARYVGFVVITTRDGSMTPIGVVTDRDLAIKAVAKNMDMRLEKVETIMTSRLITAHVNDDLDEVITLMEQNQVRRILVLDQLDQIFGIVSIDDIVSFLSKEFSRVQGLYLSQIGTSSRQRSHEFSRMI